MSQPAPVVFDTDVLVGASTHDQGTWKRYPTIPPISPSPYADCLGIVADPFVYDWALWTSDALLQFVAADLVTRHNWRTDLAERYVHRVAELAGDSGGGVISGRTVLGPQAPQRVRHVWGVAVATDAAVVVSDDPAVQKHSPWPPNKGGRAPAGTYAFDAKTFRRLVDRARRGGR